MQVGLVEGRRQIVLREIAEPEPAPGKAVVEIAYCDFGICSTDLHAWASGATAVVDPATEDVASRVRALSGPFGADEVFECTGMPQTIDQAASLAKRGGVVPLGYLNEEFDLTTGLVQDGRLELAPLHTRTVPLAEIGDAFARLHGSADEIKILVDPRS